jgi:hypothetical protein
VAGRVLERARMKSALRRHSALDFEMTLHTLEPPCSGPEIVARCALRHSFQLLVRLRQRTGRKLSCRRRAEPQRQCKAQAQ